MKPEHDLGASADSDLLAMAAKAAGAYDTREHAHAGSIYVRWDEGQRGYDAWSPLADDGDAIRLGVKLRMGLHFESQFLASGETLRIVEVYFNHDEGGSCQCETQRYTDDPMAAMRRAIVRAAAAVARGIGTPPEEAQG